MNMVKSHIVYSQLCNLRQLIRSNRKLCTDVNRWKVLKHSDNLRKDRTDATYCALKLWACNAGGGVLKIASLHSKHGNQRKENSGRTRYSNPQLKG